jgi:chloramphenicol-sensitive protein RarD
VADDSRPTAGVVYGLAAYLWWGLAPLYFKAVGHVPPDEILTHRILWSCVLLAVILGRRGEWRAVRTAVRDRRLMTTLAASTVLIALNWFVFIWAIAKGRLLQASLGYFINPLVNVMLGVLILKERLRRAQAMALGLAAAGVALMGARVGGVPAVSLILAFSFAFYGLLRKRAPVSGVVGLAVETGLLAPLALLYLVWLGSVDRLVFSRLDLRTDLLLAASGVVTALPLIWFANAARRLRLSTIGILQYVSPSLQFLLAVAVFKEPFALGELASFGLIWAALGVYTLDAIRRSSARRASPPG